MPVWIPDQVGDDRGWSGMTVLSVIPVHTGIHELRAVSVRVSIQVYEIGSGIFRLRVERRYGDEKRQGPN